MKSVFYLKADDIEKEIQAIELDDYQGKKVSFARLTNLWSRLHQLERRELANESAKAINSSIDDLRQTVRDN